MSSHHLQAYPLLSTPLPSSPPPSAPPSSPLASARSSSLPFPSYRPSSCNPLWESPCDRLVWSALAQLSQPSPLQLSLAPISLPSWVIPGHRPSWVPQLFPPDDALFYDTPCFGDDPYIPSSHDAPPYFLIDPPLPPWAYSCYST